MLVFSPFELINGVETPISKHIKWLSFDAACESFNFPSSNDDKRAIVPSSKKDTAKFWSITVLKTEDQPIEVAYKLGQKFINSKLACVKNYVASIEHGDDNDNWHIHLMVYHDGYVDFSKIKKLKDFKNRRVDVRPVTPTVRSLQTVLDYVTKGYGKYPEVDTKYGSSIFANFDIKKQMVYGEL